MNPHPFDPVAVPEAAARREFLKQAGKAAVTAPAVALLLNAAARPAAAQYRQSEEDFPDRGRGLGRR
jgi:hypothetical protein